MKAHGKTILFCIAVALLLLLALIAWMQLWDTHTSDQESRQFYDRIQPRVYSASPVSGQLPLPRIDWDTVRENCPDALAWLYCPDTPLDHPVVRAADNDYYLNHLADGTENRHGAIFVDCRNRVLFTDDNSILYGHNMKDGSMFHCLLDWADPDFAAAHPNLYILTPARSYVLNLFSAAEVPDNSDVYRRDLTHTDKAHWLSACVKQSRFTADFVPDPADKIVTLSTCTGAADRRFVVQGVVKAL